MGLIYFANAKGNYGIDLFFHHFAIYLTSYFSKFWKKDSLASFIC